MKIFELSASDEYFLLYQKTKNPESGFPILWFNDRVPLSENWIPVEVEIDWQHHFNKRRKKKLSSADFPSHTLGSLIMSKHAAESLRDYLSAYGELLPLACDEAEFWVLNVLKEVDALDYERSCPAFEGREMTPPFKSFGKQTGILSPFAFHTERLEHVDIFCLPGRRGWYFTENFVKKVESLGLTGFTVRCEFDSEAHRYGFDDLGRPLTAPRNQQESPL